ncbi:stage V sporulation protein B [Defluviitalea phaphyphila]|uniref:stage V sporulation protein B n=1 Tax=Defluviitalea phaphyphila TaxID=1473580 RepID=UPI00072FF709|nr:stage V sporulation protein B [Defluviitalea phaphyphila]
MAKRTLVTGALILTVANFITRILGFIYRIYMSNLIGAEGMGLFQLVFPVYMLAWTLSASGISLSVSKLIAQENAKREYGNMHRILKISLLLSVLIGTTISFFIYIFAPFIAINIIKESRNILALRILAFAIPFMAAASSIKGYFYGMQEMSKPAISQVLEQIIRMLIIYSLASLFVPKGLSYACALGVIGMCAGEIASFIYIFIAYRSNKSKNKLFKKPSLNLIQAYKSLLSMAIPLTGNRFITTILNSIENILIPIQLQVFGLSNSEAISIYGQFSGMAMPLIFFPSMFTTSLSMALIPAVSEATAIKNTKRIHHTVSKSIHFTCLIGIGATYLFLIFSKELGLAIYNQHEVGNMLYSMAFICPFFYLQSTLSGILNGLGQQVTTFKHNVIGSIISISFIYFLIPRLGFIGFIWSVIVSSITITLLHLNKVVKFTSISLKLNEWIIKPSLAIIASGLTTKYIMNHYFLTRFSLRPGVFFSLIILAFMYLSFLFILKSISKEDINLIKKGL